VSHLLLPYRPTPPPSVHLVRRESTSPLAWVGMRLEGSVVPLWGDVAAPAGTPVTPETRLSALLDVVPPRGVVGRLAAVWVHAGGPPPQILVVLVPPRARHTDPHPGRVSAEADLPARDVQRMGPGRVTTVQRTGLDIARWCTPPEVAHALELLVSIGFDPAAALRSLTACPGARGVRRARAALAALAEPPGSVRRGSRAGPPSVPR